MILVKAANDNYILSSYYTYLCYDYLIIHTSHFT